MSKLKTTLTKVGGISENVRLFTLEGGRRKSLLLLRCRVSSAISCIVIKSDRLSRQIPYPGETVGLSSEPGLFVVMHVDHSRHVAQLMERTGKHRLFDVPFARLRTFNRTLALAIQRFLECKDEARERETGARNP